MKRTAVVLLLFVSLVVPGLAPAHPGRLNKDGCHHVRKDFTYQSGKVVRKGEYHCHRLLVGKPAILDGSEILADRGDNEKDEEENQLEESP